MIREANFVKPVAGKSHGGFCVGRQVQRQLRLASTSHNISHSWLLNNVPMDKTMLKKWLQAGYITSEGLYQTTSGTPQGGIISPTLLVVTLSGLEQAIKAKIRNNKVNKVHCSIYADDFIISGATKEILENKVQPIVETFLGERGLTLSKEKTKITQIGEGFDFLGMNIRRYNGGKLIIKPSKQSVKRFLAEIRKVIKSNWTAKTENLIRLLNPKIRGWSNYFRNVCSSQTFNYVNNSIFKALWRWAIRRHPRKGARWVKRKYFRSEKNRSWVFSAKVKTKDNKQFSLDLIDIGLVNIRRHIKIRPAATPYDPTFNGYFARRSWCKTYAANGAKLEDDKLGNL